MASIHKTNSGLKSVPKAVVLDKGNAHCSAAFGNLLATLDLHLIKHGAGYPRLKGVIEKANKKIETEFQKEID